MRTMRPPSKSPHVFSMAFFFIWTLVLMTIAPGNLRAELVDRVIAVVDDDIITLSDLHEEGKIIFNKIDHEAPLSEKEELMAAARKRILEIIVEKHLIRQHAEKLGISVKAEEVDKELKNLLQLNNTTLEQFRQDLAQVDMDEEQYRSSIKDSLLRSKLVNYEIRSKLVISETMIQAYYETKYLTSIKEGYHILQIGFEWGDEGGRTQEEAAAKAAEVREMAINGKDFRELARLHSDLPSSRDGGDIGQFQENELASYMRDAVQALTPDEISPVIETPSGYQFFKLLSVRKGDTVFGPPLESVQQEIQETLFRQEIEKQYKQWIDDLKNQAYIKTML